MLCFLFIFIFLFVFRPGLHIRPFYVVGLVYQVLISVCRVKNSSSEYHA